MKKSLFPVFLLTFFLAGCATVKTSQSLITSAKDAMSQSLEVSCTLPEENGHRKKIFLQDKAVRIIGMAMMNGFGNAIIKDSQVWLWSSQGKEGVILDANVNDPDLEKERIKAGIPDPQKIIEELEYETQNCQAAIVADSFFVPPKNINFVGLEEFLDNLQAQP